MPVIVTGVLPAAGPLGGVVGGVVLRPVTVGRAAAAAAATVRVKIWVAWRKPLAAVIVSVEVPAVAAAVLVIVAVPLPLSTNVTPLGTAPVSLSVGVGKPAVVTVNGGETAVKMVLLALVMAGQADGRSGCSLDVERKWGKSSGLRSAERD